jgi:RHS repeat-associated protein
VTVLVRTANRGEAQITFAMANGTDMVSGDCFTVYLGSSYMQGGPWRYWEWDLAATVAALDGSDSLTHIDGIVFRVGASYDGLLVDDIVLSDGRCKRSYALVPGAAIGGVQGSWTGPNVTPKDGNSVRYFHYNDLGTVQSQTKSDGSREGVWEPDFFGNYRWAYSGSPSRPELGLTGKVWDAEAGAYYFNARWYDPERERWMSKDTTLRDGLNLYAFVRDNPAYFIDFTGRSIFNWWGGPIGTKFCMDQIYDEVNADYSGSDDGDKFKHCLVSCRAGRECGMYGADMINPVFVIAGGWIHEFMGSGWGTRWGEDESGDMEANISGLDVCDGTGCEEGCAEKYPARPR